ncbi:hypothetical protein A0H77_19625 [Vibrio alginolyticus]|uniref:hypothetical protein n=1 Tax=Vibrio alginolyticus TaxID=663 RepID=UPI00079CC53B|nr:hypothetical protein [Vibrio alginolyticus]KXZ35109.1 hypothetical protein A0H77_19625 [Vibrio alginolyticus]
MPKKSFKESLPTLARKAMENVEPNQYIAIHDDMQGKIFNGGLFKPAINLLMQLKPNQRIQYVVLEELQYRERFLEIGLIKPTKKGGGDTYTVPKDMVYCGVEE